MTAPRADAPRIYYLTPDYPAPSWGQGLLYEHVRLLREEGFDARVLHQRAPFRLPWLDSAVPIAYLEGGAEGPPAAGPDDLLVVPENLIAKTAALPWAGRRGVFVQGSFLTLVGHSQAFRYPELGVDFALAVLPHVAEVVTKHFGIVPTVVPPLVAPYFFRTPEEIRAAPRDRVVLLVCKEDYRHAGFPDYDIFVKLMRRFCGELGGGWRVEELVDMAHHEVARQMAESAFLVNLNSHEAFNSTVPEAMAAGCPVLCYEAVGGRDFLAGGENAFVFANHHVYELVEQLQRLMARGAAAPELLAMRLAARATAGRFTAEATRRALAEAFTTLLAPRPMALG